ncbi:MAG TPA: fibronectin type III domain-containing protein [Terriglobia bacterium]|nr:fibronectin type III domain-containing protein [Terriglobia bacterium]
MSKPKKIKPIDGFSNVSDADVVSRAANVQTHMTGNANFPDPPVDLAALKTAIDTLSALIAQALDGSKTVIAEKNKQREAVIKMLRLIGRYVEVTCKDDMAIFLTSGFQPASNAKTTPNPLSEKIRKIDHGANSGQINVWLKTVPKASSYELRYSAANGTAATWTTMPTSAVKAPVVLNGLTPATTYVFQARALINDAYTDWSDSVSFICT